MSYKPPKFVIMPEKLKAEELMRFRIASAEKGYCVTLLSSESNVEIRKMVIAG